MAPTFDALRTDPITSTPVQQCCAVYINGELGVLFQLKPFDISYSKVWKTFIHINSTIIIEGRYSTMIGVCKDPGACLEFTPWHGREAPLEYGYNPVWSLVARAFYVSTSFYVVAGESYESVVKAGWKRCAKPKREAQDQARQMCEGCDRLITCSTGIEPVFFLSTLH